MNIETGDPNNMVPAIPAATLILFRERADGPPELLLVERSKGMAFAGGAIVFPGGRIDADDHVLAERHAHIEAECAAARIAARLVSSMADHIALGEAALALSALGAVLSFLLGAMTSAWWMALLCTADLLACGLLVLPWLLGRKWNVWSVVIGLGIGGFLCLILASVLLTSRASAPPPVEYRSASLTTDESKENNRPAGGPGAAKLEEAGGSTGTAYQGLPAKFVMPSGTSHSSFSREMLSTRSREVRVVMLSRPVVSATGDVLIALGLLLIALQLRTLRQSLTARWHKALAARNPAPAAA